MPSFSRPMSAPAPIPMILMPRPSPSGGEWGNSRYRAVTVISTGNRSSLSTLFSSSYSADAAMGSTSSLRRS
ncbi:hypothetical protein EYF80_004921 [Liparis tanakae]|uniref:Uncharacterized protein n=1 Tax=Liparis tanakae TaxID=230148 RepID=A0A4Z2J3V4_9TELE|nr:hypothetical protein EYF80_004921 [Liparis tanakae]